MAVIYTKTEQQTAQAGERLAETLSAGAFVALDGDLGAGKTVFARGVAKGLGVKESVVSPTFTLLRAYESGRLPLYHFDAYRLSGADELGDIGFYDCADGVAVCEWAQNIAGELPVPRVSVLIERTEGGRKITIGTISAEK